MKTYLKLLLTCAVSLFIFALPFISYAAAGEGSATIDIQGEGSAGANQAVPISSNNDIVIVVTVGASGIAADGENIRITVPAGWTAPQSTTNNAAGYVTVTSSAGTVAIGAIAGQIVNINVTGALVNTNTVTFRYGNKSFGGPGSAAPAAGTAAAEFIVATDDTGANSLTEINGGTSPTVTVYGTATLTIGANTTNQAITIGNTANATLAQFSVTAGGEAVNITDIVFDIVNNQGLDFPANRFQNIRIVHDVVAGSDYDTANDTTQCGPTRATIASNQNISFDCDAGGGSNINVPSGQTRNFFVVVDTLASWLVGETARASINTATDIVASGATSGYASINATATLPVQGNILNAYDLSKRDTLPPALPTELAATVAEDLRSVRVTWKNGASADLYRTRLLRSKNDSSLSRTPYQFINAPAQEFIDTDVRVGDTLHYALTVEDTSGNESVLTSTVTLRVEAAGQAGTPNNGQGQGNEPNEGPSPGGGPPGPQGFPFLDVAESSLYRVAVEKVFEENILSGLSDTEFGLKGHLTRGQAAMMLVRALGLDEEVTEESEAFEKLKEIRVITASTFVKFHSNDDITKGDFIVMLIKARLHALGDGDDELRGLLIKKRNTLYFEDLRASNFATRYILAARDLGIFKGYKKDGKRVSYFRRPLLRGQAALLAYRAFFQ